MKFIENLPESWQEKWESLGFSSPSLIQEKTFEYLKEKENVLGISPTGSGKTLAYLLPLLLTIEKGAGNQLIILLPTQELAVQVAEVAREWANLLELKVGNFIGGVNIKRQAENLKKRPEIIIGTAGRIYELVKMKKIKLMNVETIVLDEVDSLLTGEEASFSSSLIHHVPKDFQLVFFSATANNQGAAIQKLAGEKLLVIDVTNEDRSKGEVDYLRLQVSPRKRVDTLRSLAYVENFQAIVFFNELAEVGNAEEKLLYEGVAVASLASDQNKLLRKAALDKFQSGEIKLLLTTDVLARGLDLENLSAIVNFETPLSLESFTHRTGRVGRMGKSGTVLTFVENSQSNSLKKLEKELGVTSQEIFLWGGQLVTEKPKIVEVKKKKKKKKSKR